MEMAASRARTVGTAAPRAREPGETRLAVPRHKCRAPGFEYLRLPFSGPVPGQLSTCSNSAAARSRAAKRSSLRCVAAFPDFPSNQPTLSAGQTSKSGT